MEPRTDSPNIRIGRFLWMNDQSKKRYLAALNAKIAAGYFSSEQTIAKVVDTLAPVFNDHLDSDLSISC